MRRASITTKKNKVGIKLQYGGCYTIFFKCGRNIYIISAFRTCAVRTLCTPNSSNIHYHFTLFSEKYTPPHVPTKFAAICTTYFIFLIFAYMFCLDFGQNKFFCCVVNFAIEEHSSHSNHISATNLFVSFSL